MEQFNRDDVEFLVIGANIAGWHEKAGNIEITDDQELTSSLIRWYQAYQNSKADYWVDFVEQKLLDRYGCKEGIKHVVA